MPVPVSPPPPVRSPNAHLQQFAQLPQIPLRRPTLSHVQPVHASIPVGHARVTSSGSSPGGGRAEPRKSWLVLARKGRGITIKQTSDGDLDEDEDDWVTAGLERNVSRPAVGRPEERGHVELASLISDALLFSLGWTSSDPSPDPCDRQYTACATRAEPCARARPYASRGWGGLAGQAYAREDHLRGHGQSSFISSSAQSNGALAAHTRLCYYFFQWTSLFYHFLYPTSTMPQPLPSFSPLPIAALFELRLLSGSAVISAQLADPQTVDQDASRARDAWKGGVRQLSLLAGRSRTPSADAGLQESVQ
jgi:hypothetical protein